MAAIRLEDYKTCAYFTCGGGNNGKLVCPIVGGAVWNIGTAKWKKLSLNWFQKIPFLTKTSFFLTKSFCKNTLI